ncbi:MAG: anti-sigma factor domain-containing protein [Eubacteriales bacterium]|nr:anti-sigma factor domain-containing protein [Eubacteriales bacterium]
MKRKIGACIVELRGRSAAALTEDGQFVRIRNRNYEVGQTVLLYRAESQPARRLQLRALASMAAGLLLLILGGFKGYQTPAGVVSLDVNPSVEYTINVFDRVLAVDAVNDDGGRILAKMDGDSLLYLPVDEAIEQTIETLRKSGYLNQEAENDVVIAASSFSARHAERLAAQLKTRVALQRDLTVVSVSVTGEEVDQAHALGASAGKLYLVEQLEKSGGSSKGVVAEDWLDRPVREILTKTKEQEAQNPSFGGAKPDPQAQDEQNGDPYLTPDPQLPQESEEPGGGKRKKSGIEPKQNSGGTSNPAQGSSGGESPHG